MPPLRFKAVCTETGREFFPDRQGLDENSPPWLERKTRNLYSWAVQVWIPVGHTNIELCQSTGLTDAMKKEIFFDDVILLLNEKSPNYGHLFIVSFEDCTIVFKRMDGKTCFWASSREHYKPEYVVIGNRWMPQAELKARAEAVSNG